jgi:dihydroorotase (multifunctional complex type)
MPSDRFDMILKGGDVCLPGGGVQAADIAVSGGVIAAILDAGTPADAAETLDVSGLTILPGVIDGHLHLGHGADISRPRTKGDAGQETAAAATGGVTTMIPYLMAQEPFGEIFDGVRDVTKAGARIDFSYHFIISTPAQLEHVPDYIRQGVPTFKIFMNNRGGEGARLGLPDIDDAFLYRLAELSAAHGGMVCPHPENIEVAQYLRKAVMERDPDGKSGLAGWNETRPPFVEADAVQRAALLCRVVGAPVYIVHTSSAEALEAASHARDTGTRIHIETCPHYLTHDVGWGGGDIGKINPPLREKRDTERLWQGIADGTIDTVATDHVHRDLSSKNGGIWKASPGCPGMETLLPVMLSEGLHKRGVPLARIVSLLCENPAKIMGLGRTKGLVAPGYDADFAVVDLNAATRIDNAKVVSGAGYSIYDGWDLKGRVVHTLVRGKPVYRDQALDEEAVGWGRFQKRSLLN